MKETLLYLGIICFIVLYYVSPISIDITIHDNNNNNKVLTKEINTSMTKTKDELLAEYNMISLPESGYLYDTDTKELFFNSSVFKQVFQDIFTNPRLFTEYLEIGDYPTLSKFLRDIIKTNHTRYGLDGYKDELNSLGFNGEEAGIADYINGLLPNELLEALGEPGSGTYIESDKTRDFYRKFWKNDFHRNKENVLKHYMNIMGKSSEDFEKFYNDALGWSEEIPSSNDLNYEKLKPYIPKPEAKETLEEKLEQYYEKLKPYIPKLEAKEALEDELKQYYETPPEEELEQYYETTPENDLDQYYETTPEEELEQYYEEEPIQEPSLSTSNAQPSPIKYFDASNYQIVQSPEQSLALDNRLAEIAKKRLVNQVLNEPKMGDGTIMQQLARLYENNNKRASRFMDRNFTN